MAKRNAVTGEINSTGTKMYAAIHVLMHGDKDLIVIGRAADRFTTAEGIDDMRDRFRTMSRTRSKSRSSSDG